MLRIDNGFKLLLVRNATELVTVVGKCTRTHARKQTFKIRTLSHTHFCNAERSVCVCVHEKEKERECVRGGMRKRQKRSVLRLRGRLGCVWKTVPSFFSRRARMSETFWCNKRNISSVCHRKWNERFYFGDEQIQLLWYYLFLRLQLKIVIPTCAKSRWNYFVWGSILLQTCIFIYLVVLTSFLFFKTPKHRV